ncbi:MAG: hypothetical protein IT179_08105 [Acidobacteria bacterium]|nr:hypothetical protein [Acidobacteriota bacterium]
MTTRRVNRPHLLTTLALALATAAPAAAQSLGDVARAEAERRNALPAQGRVYTNESLTPDFTKPPAPAAPAPARETAEPAGAPAEAAPHHPAPPADAPPQHAAPPAAGESGPAGAASPQLQQPLEDKARTPAAPTRPPSPAA